MMERELGAGHFEARAVPVHGHRGVEPLEGVAQLGTAVPARTALEHGAGKGAGRVAAAEALLVAPVQQQARDDHATARLLRQQSDAHAVGERLADHARFDVGGRRIERLALVDRLSAPVGRERSSRGAFPALKPFSPLVRITNRPCHPSLRSLMTVPMQPNSMSSE